MEIKPITYKETQKLSSMKHEQVEFRYNLPNCYYLGAYENGMLVGMVAWQIMKNGNILRYKSDCVLPAYRKRGIYSALWKARDEATKNIKYELVTAFCTQMSIGMYLSHGFSQGKTNKNNVTFVKKENRK